LNNPFYSENAEITYCGNLQQYYRLYVNRHYLLLVFNESNGLKLMEKDMHQGNHKDINSRNNRRFSDLVPILDAKLIQDMAYSLETEYNKVLEIMELFDFCDKVTDLGSDDFYSLMLKLPEYDFQKSIDLSKSVYRIIEQTNFTIRYEDSESKNRFFDVGKVLVQLKENYNIIQRKNHTYQALRLLVNRMFQS